MGGIERKQVESLGKTITYRADLLLELVNHVKKYHSSPNYYIAPHDAKSFANLLKEVPMKSKVFNQHWLDKKGNPAGGVSFGNGFAISWQNGPLGRGKNRKEPNGAFVEDVISAVLSRLYFYQRSKFRCKQNAHAIDHLNMAAVKLLTRTAIRKAAGIEGTYRV